MFLKFVNWTLNAFNNDSQEYMSEQEYAPVWGSA